jgi:hypothetical protein
MIVAGEKFLTALKAPTQRQSSGNTNDLVRAVVRVSRPAESAIAVDRLLSGFHSSRNAVYVCAHPAPVAQLDRATDSN